MMRLGGFTLIELITVVIILGILAAIATPLFINTIEKTRQEEAIPVLAQMYRGYKKLILEEVNMTGPLEWEDFDFDQYPGIASRYFDYFMQIGGSNNFGLAQRRGDATKWIRIDFDTGNITKSQPY